MMNLSKLSCTRRALCLSVVLMLCLQVGAFLESNRAIAQEDSSDPHRHINPSESMLQDFVDVLICELWPEKSWKRENVTTNKEKTYTAFTVCHPLPPPDQDSCQEQIYFEEKKTGKVYEVNGLLMPHRPFSDLAWASDDTLLFDRWSQPHYGFHYAVNVKALRLVAAHSFTD